MFNRHFQLLSGYAIMKCDAAYVDMQNFSEIHFMIF